MRKHRINSYALYTFYTCSIINLLEQIVRTGWLDMATKPLLMVTLLLYYLTAPTDKSTTLSRLVVAALVFSWFGDILLMLQHQVEGLFIFGLAAFLIAHVFYIFVEIQVLGP